MKKGTDKIYDRAMWSEEVPPTKTTPGNETGTSEMIRAIVNKRREQWAPPKNSKDYSNRN